ncbi:Uncharacterised protein [Cedecea neteri]|uniref:Uncharacterized protein n=1 Tax=Cedecea neteri TaxID=158822 RepID=A0A291E5Z6_9ENTR|nr:hypothetical protein [Cedecea neteri]ATF95485.1 hypothetical protein CO704_25785 [Cedecea neteri]SQC92080.1 Uncharacterised protein [Cedecea neteri]
MKLKHLGTSVLLAAMVCWSSLSTATSEQEVNARLDQLFNTHQEYHNFLDNLQTQLISENKVEVAKLISYPIKVNIDGKKIKIKTPQQLIKLYGSIFTPALVKVVNTQQYKDLLINAQGVMIGNGQIWFSSVCGDNQCKKSTVLITTINK